MQTLSDRSVVSLQSSERSRSHFREALSSVTFCGGKKQPMLSLNTSASVPVLHMFSFSIRLFSWCREHRINPKNRYLQGANMNVQLFTQSYKTVTMEAVR